MSDDQFYLLCSECDLIFHSGALVNFIYNFSKLKAPNIDGTKTVIELAAKIKIKPIHYVSSVGIYPCSFAYERKIFIEDDNIGEFTDVLVGGYVQTKWVSDNIMQKARNLGIPVTIYRPGRISWDSENNLWQDYDAVYRFIYGCIQLGCIPNLPVSVDLNPVNVVSKMIAYISYKNTLVNSNYNIVNPSKITISELVTYLQEMGIKLDIISYTQWRGKLYSTFSEKQNNVLFPMLDLFAESLNDMPRLRYNRNIDCTKLLTALNGSSIKFPLVNYSFLYPFITKHFNPINKPQ